MIMRKHLSADKKNALAKLVLLCTTVTVIFSACSFGKSSEEVVTDENGNKINTDLSYDEAARQPVIVVGTEQVYLDEVRYYTYTTQATYETYYATEDKELDWNMEMSVGVTLAEAVKSNLLDAICEREALSSYAEEYGVSFSEEELTKISKKVDKFYAKTNEKLLDRIKIKTERLKEVFEKDELSKKVKEKLEGQQTGKAEEVYKNWKKANTVTTNEYWDALNFNTPILN